MTAARKDGKAFRSSPIRRASPGGALALSLMLTLRRNPIEIWVQAHFERPFSIGRSILGLRAVVHDPAAVRRVFLDNAANYRKDALQLRVLRPGLGNGLLTAEGEAWRLQRRVAGAAVFAAPGRRVRAGDAARRCDGGRASRPSPRRRA